MLDPVFSAVIVLVFIVAFAFVLPVLNVKHEKYVSYRWSVVVVILALMIAVTTDFEFLGERAREIILTGGLIITGVYVALRTWEKAISNGWQFGVKVKKGDTEAELHGADVPEGMQVQKKPSEDGRN